MDLKQIEELMAAMNRNGMSKVALKHEGFELEIEKQQVQQPAAHIGSMPAHIHAAPPPPSPQAHEKTEAPVKEEGEYIVSPMVGTFYAASSPKDSPFVKEGDTVDEESVVCIIEAMKVMNEVKAGLKGKVIEVLAKNGDPIEFGTKIFRIV